MRRYLYAASFLVLTVLCHSCNGKVQNDGQDVHRSVPPKGFTMTAVPLQFPDSFYEISKGAKTARPACCQGVPSRQKLQARVKHSND